MFVCKKNNLIKYIDLLKDLIETYFIIIEIGISISLKMISKSPISMRPDSASRSFRHEIWVISFDGKEIVWLIVTHWKAKTDHFILREGGAIH